MSETDVLDFFAFAFTPADRPPAFVRLPKLDIPQGSAILRVFHEPLDRVFHFLVYHPSFDTVPDGQRPPSLGPVPLAAVVMNLGGVADEPDHLTG